MSILLRVKKSWELPESAVASESTYLNRRQIVAGFAAAGALGSTSFLGARAASASTADLYPVATKNPRYLDGGRPITPEQLATTYNNYYEFGATKNIWRNAQKLTIDPWTVKIDGLVDNPGDYDFEDLVRSLPLEERVYRLRCVEAWSMVVPWSGFTLASLLNRVGVQNDAKYIRFETFGEERRDEARGLAQAWYPWPYVEGLRMDEAMNDLTFIATGLYGKEIPKQNGAPLRLHTPWKYGFKSLKGISRITLTDKQPVSFWEQLQEREYGFWANVNPEVDHPRWTQATERDLETGERIPTLPWNGYGEEVAAMYRGMEAQLGDRLYR